MVTNYLSGLRLLIFTVLNFFHQNVSSFFQFLLLLTKIFCIFSATPVMIMHFFDPLWGPCQAFLQAISDIQSLVNLLLQFLKIILLVSNWSFALLDFLKHSFCFFCSSENSLFFQMILQLVKYSSEYIPHKRQGCYWSNVDDTNPRFLATIFRLAVS